MELKELEYIVAIAEEGSVSRAAERLFMAQSSLSQFLSRYEAELGAKLFVRTAGGARPTSSGELFIQSARQILHHYHTMKTDLRETERPRAGRIEFGISSFRGSYLLPPVLRRFREEFPNVEVVIHEHDTAILQKKMATGEFDLALIALREDEEHPKDAPVMQDEVCIVANRAHPVMDYVQTGRGGPDRPWVSLSDMARFELLLSNRFTVLGSIANRLFRQEGIEPRALNENLSAAFAASMAAAGLGLAFTYRSCTRPDPDTVYLSVGPRRCFVDLVTIYPPDGYRSRASRALEKMLRQYICRKETGE